MTIILPNSIKDMHVNYIGLCKHLVLLLIPPLLIVLQIVVDFINGQSALSPSGSRATLIEFSSPRLTKLVFGFGDYKYAYDVKNQIKNLRYDNGKYEYRPSFALLLFGYFMKQTMYNIVKYTDLSL